VAEKPVAEAPKPKAEKPAAPKPAADRPVTEAPKPKAEKPKAEKPPKEAKPKAPATDDAGPKLQERMSASYNTLRSALSEEELSSAISDVEGIMEDLKQGKRLSTEVEQMADIKIRGASATDDRNKAQASLRAALEMMSNDMKPTARKALDVRDLIQGVFDQVLGR
jgi:hypothetical protein